MGDARSRRPRCWRAAAGSSSRRGRAARMRPAAAASGAVSALDDRRRPARRSAPAPPSTVSSVAAKGKAIVAQLRHRARPVDDARMKSAIAAASSSGSRGSAQSGSVVVGGDRDDDSGRRDAEQRLAERRAVDLDLGMGMPLEALDQQQIDRRSYARTSSSSAGSGAPRSSCISAQRRSEATITSCAPAWR